MKKILLASIAALALNAWAQSSVKIEDAWVRGTVAQQKATGAFMRLTAPRDTRLVAVSSPVAGVVELHEMSLDNGVMKMRAIAGLALPAGKTVELKPGGYHVMLLDLKAPVAAEQQVPLTLVFEAQGGQREQVELKAPARALNAGAMSGPMGQGHQHGRQH
ncbi:copper chaperone PCu(A)C [Malikia sp.]|uniref:copper chaperone PCu(A)C n=1 Tax=Malikia sp. TaxID=2070706 RepID=UPI002623A92B|nr:copper chaperone PCu(A)C [Malikia sp.]MDD2728214.1 copper chaperone PCu(A)C [Malikia sp.]